MAHEVFFTAFVAFVAVHVYYLMRFSKGTDKSEKFDIAYWWNDNAKDYITSIAVIILLMLMLDWHDLFELYKEHILSRWWWLGFLKPHALFAFIISFFGTSIVRKVWKTGEKKIEEKIK